MARGRRFPDDSGRVFPRHGCGGEGRRGRPCTHDLGLANGDRPETGPGGRQGRGPAGPRSIPGTDVAPPAVCARRGRACCRPPKRRRPAGMAGRIDVSSLNLAVLWDRHFFGHGSMPLLDRQRWCSRTTWDGPGGVWAISQPKRDRRPRSVAHAASEPTRRHTQMSRYGLRCGPQSPPALCSMSYGSAPLGSVTSRYAGLPRRRSRLQSATLRTKARLAGSPMQPGNRNGGDE